MRYAKALKAAHARSMIRSVELFGIAMANDLHGEEGRESYLATLETQNLKELMKEYGFLKPCETVIEAKEYCKQFEEELACQDRESTTTGQSSGRTETE